MHVDRIRADNEQKKDVERKCGLIIWSGRELAQQSFDTTLTEYGVNGTSNVNLVQSLHTRRT